jgi:hypothetical protein
MDYVEAQADPRASALLPHGGRGHRKGVLDSSQLARFIHDPACRQLMGGDEAIGLA